MTNRLAAGAVNQLRVNDWHYLSAHMEDAPDFPEMINWDGDGDG